MLIRFIDAPAVPGGKAIALCDDDGVALPMQVRSAVSTGIDEVSEITVTFTIDGKKLRFAD